MFFPITNARSGSKRPLRLSRTHGIVVFRLYKLTCFWWRCYVEISFKESVNEQWQVEVVVKQSILVGGRAGGKK